MTQRENPAGQPGMAFVTGGSRGIGAAICQRLAAEGYPVAVCYAHNRAAAEAVVSSIEQAGGQAAAFALDTIEPVIEQAEAALGPLRVLIANAGIIGEAARVDAQTDDNIEAVLRVNTIAPIVCARAAVKRLSTRHGGLGGAIVLMSSVAATSGGPNGGTIYGASKGALETFTVGLAKEVADEGIRVNAIAPGIIDTDMPPADLREIVDQAVPMRRLGKPEEIADAVAWLVSDRASFVTGESVKVSGGR